LTRQERKEYYYWLNRRINDGKIEKRCTMCNEWKEDTIDSFYMQNKSKPELGLVPACKICLTAKSIAHRLLNVERARQSIRDHYYRHKEIYNTRAKAYNKEHREKTVEDHNLWVKNNPDKVRLYYVNHRDHDISNKEWDSCLSIFDYSCAYCGISEEDHLSIYNQVLHKEHVDDKGYNDLRNAVPSCRRCNSYKHQADMEEWYRKQDYFDEERFVFIKWWIVEGYKEYIESKPPYRVIREKNIEDSKYHFNLWSVDEMRNTLEIIATKNRKKELKINIEEYLTKLSNN